MRQVPCGFTCVVYTRGEVLQLPRQTYHGGQKMKREKSLSTLAGEYSSLAFALPVSCLAGYAIGYYLDRYFETHFLYIVFLLLGVASGFLQIYKQIQKEDKDSDGA